MCCVFAQICADKALGEIASTDRSSVLAITSPYHCQNINIVAPHSHHHNIIATTSRRHDITVALPFHHCHSRVASPSQHRCITITQTSHRHSSTSPPHRHCTTNNPQPHRRYISHHYASTSRPILMRPIGKQLGPEMMMSGFWFNQALDH